MRPVPLFAALAALGTTFVNGKVYNSLSELPARDQDYDFIVVGSGPGGATVANRLTEDPKVKVLLVEGGPDNEGVLELEVPAFWTTRINNTFNWNYVSVPQAGLNNRRVPYARGRVLGGSTNLNGMVYTRGAADDYNLWAKITGDNGWTWDKMFQYVKKHETWQTPAGGRDVSGQFNPAVHGFSGPVKVSLPSAGPNTFDNRALQVSKSNKEFPFNIDYNSGKPLGLGWLTRTIGDGERSSAATAYLNTTVRARPNLSIVLNTYALRVLPTGNVNKKEFRTLEIGVRFSKDETRKVTASKEVILSAGAYGSPQILLNSGIGDKQELEKIGVKSVHNLPWVGKDISDHITTPLSFNTSGEVIRPPFDEAAALQEWQTNRTGPLTEATPDHQLLWTRIPSNATIWKTYKDPVTIGNTTPHIEITLDSGSTPGTVGIVVVLLKPYSRGSIRINSTDPYQDPLIDLGFLTHDFDIEALKEGVRATKRFFSGPAWDGFKTSPVAPDPDVDANAFVEYLRNVAFGVFHPVGSAAMSAKGSQKGVVDPDLTVKGLKGLRIVDGSVIPYVPACHTQATVYIMAERGADLIKQAWSRR